jgi:hypothetical protein
VKGRPGKERDFQPGEGGWFRVALGLASGLEKEFLSLIRLIPTGLWKSVHRSSQKRANMA